MNLLQNRFPHIKFQHIPEAWAYEIDLALSRINNSKVISVSQFMGFLNIDCSFISRQEQKILKALEKRLYSIDIDLHEQLHEGIILN